MLRNAETFSESRFNKIKTLSAIAAIALAGVMQAGSPASAEVTIYSGGTWDKHSAGSAGQTEVPDVRIEKPAEPPIIGAMPMLQSVNAGSTSVTEALDRAPDDESMTVTGYSAGAVEVRHALQTSNSTTDRVTEVRLPGDPCARNGILRLAEAQMLTGTSCGPDMQLASDTIVTEFGYQQDPIFNMPHMPATLAQAANMLAGYYNAKQGHGSYDYLDPDTIDPSRKTVVVNGNVHTVTLKNDTSASVQYLREHGMFPSVADESAINSMVGFTDEVVPVTPPPSEAPVAVTPVSANIEPPRVVTPEAPQYRPPELAAASSWVDTSASSANVTIESYAVDIERAAPVAAPQIAQVANQVHEAVANVQQQANQFLAQFAPR